MGQTSRQSRALADGLSMNLAATTLVAAFALAGSPASAHDRESAAGGLSLHGTVVSEPAGGPVPGASVQLVELGRVTSTDESGGFEFSNLPRGHCTVGVHASGYASQHVPVVVPAGDPLRITLSADHHFEEEVTVTATAWTASPLETAQTVDLVDSVSIRENGASSVGEALRSVPGVSMIGTGDALGTPVVRGLSETRVRILNDGVPLNHQQFSSRHSPALDPLLADRIEVVKGPASVLWGPQAMGGVINLVRAPLPTAGQGQTTFHGQVVSGFRSNTGEWSGQVALEGAAGGLGWRLTAVQRSAGDIETPRASLDGTDYDQLSGDLTLGYTSTWGSLRLRSSHWDNDVGLFRPEGFRLDLEDDSIVADGLFPMDAGELSLLVSRQTNTRKAFPVALAGLPSVDLELVTDTGRVGFSHQRLGHWRGKVAFESSRVVNEARALRALLPEYDSDNYALMGWEEGRFWPSDSGDHDRIIVSLGLRWDGTDLVVPEDGPRSLPGGFRDSYSALTGAVGLVLRARPTFSLAANVGRGWRPPSVFELFANGVHGGVSAVQLGNLELREESNLNTEISGRWQSAHVKATLTGFRNSFEDYIYLAGTEALDDASGLPIFGYRQADAILDGIEASFEALPRESLLVGLSCTLISTKNKATGRGLPQTPPDWLSGFARYSRQTLGPLVSPFAEIEARWTDRGEISGPDEPFGTPTDSHTLLRLKTGFRLVSDDGVVGFDLAINNLLDEEYTDFLWPYKGFDTLNPGRDIRLTTSFSF